jgi:predicted NAD-dependent protein-ADP-ribosyltransferase YbiA (DUF1768 family)
VSLGTAGIGYAHYVKKDPKTRFAQCDPKPLFEMGSPCGKKTADSPAPVKLPRLSPIVVPLPDLGDVNVVAFYAPGSGLTPVDIRTGGGPFANFWPLAPYSITVSHNGCSGTFTNTEAAYQCFKWWQHEASRKAFEGCNSPGLEGGEEAFQLKRRLEETTDKTLMALKHSNFDGLGKLGAMLVVLRQKWRLPQFKEFLLSTEGMLLVEHCPVEGRDLVWTDNHTGGGLNMLGACLMLVREELLREVGGSSDGWPKGIEKPEYLGGSVGSNWQARVDAIAKYLAAHHDSKL